MSKASYQKLRASILEHGISFPFFVWLDEDKEAWTIDGHQRDRALRLMRREGYVVPKVPVTYIHAKDEADAKKKILLNNSRFGRLDDESLYFYIEENALDFSQIKPWLDLPEFTTKSFEEGWIKDIVPLEKKAKSKTMEGPAVIRIFHNGDPKQEIELPDGQWSISIEKMQSSTVIFKS